MARPCIICYHPNRTDIEQSYSWRQTSLIAKTMQKTGTTAPLGTLERAIKRHMTDPFHTGQPGSSDEYPSLESVGRLLTNAKPDELPPVEKEEDVAIAKVETTICDFCGEPSSQTMTFRGPDDKNHQLDVCDADMADLVRKSHPPRRGRRPSK